MLAMIFDPSTANGLIWCDKFKLNDEGENDV